MSFAQRELCVMVKLLIYNLGIQDLNHEIVSLYFKG